MDEQHSQFKVRPQGLGERALQSSSGFYTLCGTWRKPAIPLPEGLLSGWSSGWLPPYFLTHGTVSPPQISVTFSKEGLPSLWIHAPAHFSHGIITLTHHI